MYALINKIKYSFFTLFLFGSLHVIASERPVLGYAERIVYSRKYLQHNLTNKANSAKKNNKYLTENNKYLTNKNNDLTIRTLSLEKHAYELSYKLLEEKINKLEAENKDQEELIIKQQKTIEYLQTETNKISTTIQEELIHREKLILAQQRKIEDLRSENKILDIINTKQDSLIKKLSNPKTTTPMTTTRKRK
jgi:hypothetical protein